MTRPGSDSGDLPALCLFDLGNVAARFVPDRRLPALARLFRREPEEVSSILFRSGLSARLDVGAHDLRAQCGEMSKVFGVVCDPDDLVQAWCLAFEPAVEVLALAERVGERIRVGLLTNNPPSVEVGLPLHLPSIARCFGLRLFSSRLGAAKPDPALFERVEQRTGLKPLQLALIDDSPAHVEAAVLRGWTGIRFQDHEALEAELRLRGWMAA